MGNGGIAADKMEVNGQLHTRPVYPLSRKAGSVWELRKKNSVQGGHPGIFVGEGRGVTLGLYVINVWF